MENQIAKKENFSKNGIQIVLISILVIGSYINTLGNGFALDDGAAIETNEQIKSLKNIPMFFQKDFFFEKYEMTPFYRPLINTILALEYFVFGNEPLFYHAINVLLHFSICILLLLYLNKLFNNHTLSLISVALFAVHPVNTEAVTAIMGLCDLVPTLFILIAMIMFNKYISCETKKYRYLMFFTFAYIAALFSKENAIIILLLMLLNGISLLKTRSNIISDTFKIIKNNILVYAIFIIASVGFFALRHHILSNLIIPEHPFKYMGNPFITETPDFITVISSSFLLIGKYLSLMFMPINLAADYSYNQIPVVQSFFSIDVIWPFILMVTILITLFKTYKRNIEIFFGLAYFSCGLLAISFIFPFYNMILAERFIYIFTIGLFIAIGQISSVLINKEKYKKPVIILLSLVVLTGSIRTFYRNYDWFNNFTLFKAGVEATPNCARMHHNLGNEYITRFDIKNAFEHYQKAATIDPTNKMYLYSYGTLLINANELNKAEALLSQSSKLGFKKSEYKLFLVYIIKGEYEKALTFFNEKKLNKTNLYGDISKCYNLLGLYNETIGKYQDAENFYKQEMKFRFQSYVNSKWDDKNIENYFNALEKVNRNNFKFQVSIGLFYIYFNQKPEKAENHLLQACKLTPQDPFPHVYLLELYSKDQAKYKTAILDEIDWLKQWCKGMLKTRKKIPQLNNLFIILDKIDSIAEVKEFKDFYKNNIEYSLKIHGK